MPLHDYLRAKASPQTFVFTVKQIQCFINQIAMTAKDLHERLKFVHGNLDSGSVFIDSRQPDQISVKLDLSQNYKLL